MNRLLLLSNFVSSKEPKASQADKIIVERKEELAILWMNSPADSNTMTVELVKQLLAALVDVDHDKSTKVIILRSKVKKVFSSGGDIKQFANLLSRSELLVASFQKIRRTILSVRKPIISVVEGYALGGGFEIAMLSDIIICSKDAHFGLPEIKIGVIPGLGGTQNLPRLAKQANAMRMILTGGTIDAYEAHKRNIALLIPNKFQERLQIFISNIVNRPLDSLILAKKAVKFATQTMTEEGLVHEADLYPSLMGKQGPLQGVTAFLERRKPNFKGI